MSSAPRPARSGREPSCSSRRLAPPISTYVEATWSQKLSDWISSHARAFTFFGGVPAQVVSDNLKAGVTKACFYGVVARIGCQVLTQAFATTTDMLNAA